MRLRLIPNGISRYGIPPPLSKMSALFLLLATPVIAERVDIVAFGDSLTQGYGLIEQEGFVPQLRKWLAEQGVEARVVNAGVSGDTTAGGAARVDWSLTAEIDAMIVALGGNDLLRGIDPEASRANLNKILESAAARDVVVLLVGMTAPGNYGESYKAAFDAIYPELAEAHGALYFESFFKGLGEVDPAQAQEFFQPDGLHPNAEGIRRIVLAIGPAVLELIAMTQAK